MPREETPGALFFGSGQQTAKGLRRDLDRLYRDPRPRSIRALLFAGKRVIMFPEM